MGLRGRFADDQLVANLWVGQATYEQLQRLELLGGERGDGRWWRWHRWSLTGELLDDRPGDGRSKQGFAAGNDADGCPDLFGGRIFEHEAAGTSSQGVENVAIEAEGGQDEDTCVRAALG